MSTVVPIQLIARNGLALRLLIGTVICTFSADARAGDVIHSTPRNAAGLLTFRSIQNSDAQLKNVIRQLIPQYEGLPLSDLETTLGFVPGTIDLTKRVSIVFLQPDELTEFIVSPGLGSSTAAYPVVAFTPLQMADFMANGAAENRIHSSSGPWCRYYYFVRDGQVYVSNQRRPLRVLIRVHPRDSLSDAMSDEQLEAYQRGDFFLHMPMAAWRERISPFLAVAGSLVELGAAVQLTPEEVQQTRSFREWMIKGVEDAVQQMMHMSISLRFDGPTIRLQHIHAFDQNRWVARYLRSVRRSGDAPFKALPDRPFLALGYMDWMCPPDTALSYVMLEKLLSDDRISAQYSPDMAKKLLAATLSFYRDFRLSDVMFCGPENGLMPFEVFGSYTTNGDAAKMVELYQFTQENSGEAWSSLFSGVGKGGRFRKVIRDGVEVSEMRFDEPGMDAAMVESIKEAYGPDVRLQLATAGDQHVVYAFTQSPSEITELIRCVSTGKGVAHNSAVLAMRSAMPDDANVVVMCDLNRLVAAATENLSGQVPSNNHKETGRTVAHNQRRDGPLLGWSCKVTNNLLDCQFTMDAQDLAKLRLPSFETPQPTAPSPTTIPNR